MKYMVKCAYCDKTFVVDTNTKDPDFICESCSGKCGKDDIIQEIREQKTVVWRSGNRAEDEAWKVLKSFDVSEHEGKAGKEEAPEETLYDIVSGASTSKKAWLFHYWPFLVIGAIIIIVGIIYEIYSFFTGLFLL